MLYQTIISGRLPKVDTWNWIKNTSISILIVEISKGYTASPLFVSVKAVDGIETYFGHLKLKKSNQASGIITSTISTSTECS